MRRIAFHVDPADKEPLLDAVLPLLPAGVRERVQSDGTLELSSVGADLPPRERLERAAGRELAGWHSEAVPADWRARRALFGGGHAIGDRLVVRSPWDPAPEGDAIDIVVERAGNAFGSGSHPTTRMCLELLLSLEPDGGAVDLGCGVGVLALAAARLGWDPVSGVDRAPEAIEAAMENAQRNGVEVGWEIADLVSADVPVAALLLANAPPPVHLRAASAVAAAGGDVRHVIVSGIALHEAPAVVEAYASAGMRDVLTLEDEAWAAILLERASA
jgi:ribosomal protein L11 methyltransferase